MEHITDQQIDDIIIRKFIEKNENVVDDFVNNYNAYKKIFDECARETAPDAPSSYIETFTNEFSAAFACFKLAQDNCIDILRKSLKELLCKEETIHTEKERKGA